MTKMAEPPFVVVVIRGDCGLAVPRSEQLVSYRRYAGEWISSLLIVRLTPEDLDLLGMEGVCLGLETLDSLVEFSVLHHGIEEQ